MVDQAELSELLVTKMCHDLSGPVGAVNNGMELLNDADEELMSQAVDLVQSSARESVARVMYFRQAFGLIHKDSDISLENLQDVVGRFFEPRKSSVQWGDIENLQNINISPANIISKSVLNGLGVVEACLISGGEITVNVEQQSGNYYLTINAKSDIVKLIPEVEMVFDSDVNNYEVNLKNAQAVYLVTMVKNAGAKALLNVEQNSVRLQIG